MVRGYKSRRIGERGCLDYLYLQLPVHDFTNVRGDGNRKTSGLKFSEEDVGLLSSSESIGFQKVESIVPGARNHMSEEGVIGDKSQGDTHIRGVR